MRKDASPCYIVFAGVNGAGKSTLFNTGLWRLRGMPARLPRVNPDEIVREMGGDWRSSTDQMKAAREAVLRIRRLLDAKASFNQETTLSGHAAIGNIRRAHDAGYRVYLYYVGVDDADIALARIAHRTEVGGHDIDRGAVMRRYRTSLSGLAKVLDFCEAATVFDNTRSLTSVAAWHRGTLSWWGNPQTDAPWLLRAMTDNELWRRT